MRAWLRFLSDPTGVLSASILLILVAAAVGAPLLTDQLPGTSSLDSVLAPPSADHILGADGSGRDLLAVLLYGARQSLLAGVIAILVALAIGVPSGLIAGYFGKRLDSAASWVSDLLMSLPAIVVLLAVIARTGPIMPATMAAYGVLCAPFFFRIVRGATRGVRKELYVDAAVVSGLGDARILGRHVLPAIRGPILIQGSLIFGSAIVAQAGLEFLGLGDPATASWGSMLNDAIRNVYVAPTLIVLPGAALAVTACALALLGSSLSDTLSRRDRRADRAVGTAEGHAESGALRPGLDPREAALTLRGLRVRYGQVDVVHGISLDLARGEILGLVGESGSGKTQVALGCLGLLPRGATVETAALVIAGETVRTASATGFDTVRGKRIAYVPQEPLSNLDPSFTVATQVTEPMRHHLRITRREARQRAVDLLRRVGINDPDAVMEKYPHELSGGMAQRVLIAAAVSCDPDILIADEPTTALDVTVQADVLDLLRQLREDRGMAVLIVTHNFGVVADLCDRVAVMKSGEIVESGPVIDVLRHPQHEYTRSLLASSLDSALPRAERDSAHRDSAHRDSTKPSHNEPVPAGSKEAIRA